MSKRGLGTRLVLITPLHVHRGDRGEDLPVAPRAPFREGSFRDALPECHHPHSRRQAPQRCARSSGFPFGNDEVRTRRSAAEGRGPAEALKTNHARQGLLPTDLRAVSSADSAIFADASTIFPAMSKGLSNISFSSGALALAAAARTGPGVTR